MVAEVMAAVAANATALNASALNATALNATALNATALNATALNAITAVEPKICEPGGAGLFFPLLESEQHWDNKLRALLYTVTLFYLFAGVSVVADRFMEAIDQITSRKRIVRLPNTGRLVTVETWNGTLANLTLLALGSSAPEILLSIVEVFMNKFHAGALGPGTMIGSAAFNLCCIVAVAISSIPNHEKRQVKHQAVFYVTAIFALGAYVWLVFIVQVNTPDVITVGEGVATVGFYPILLVIAYLAHIGYFSGKTKEPDAPVVQPLRAEYGDPDCIRDLKGHPIVNPHGVLTFEDDAREEGVGLKERVIMVPVFRKNGVWGTVKCNYRTEGRSAVAGHDFLTDEGEVCFPPGIAEAEIPITLLPKSLGEHSDKLQIIIENATGGATFNPNSDGKEERCVLTVHIFNANDGLTNRSPLMRVSQLMDGILNMDAVHMATVSWSENIVKSVVEVGDGESEPTAKDYIMHLIFLPWRLGFAVVVPPAGYFGGWLSFLICMAFIGLMSSIICDFSELFGCVTGIEDYITAITFVALGTSMPDLFVSMTAAVQDEHADSSIVTVTGGDSARVFLGIGIPWTIAAIYWSAVGATDEWTRMYPDYVDANPGGAFIVPGGMLGFNVVIYLMVAIPALAVIQLRRVVLGGELGGPFGPKVLTSLMFVLLWFFYVGMSIWKITSASDDIGEILHMTWNMITALEHIGLLLAVIMICCSRRSSSSAPPSDIEATPGYLHSSHAVPNEPRYDGLMDSHLRSMAMAPPQPEIKLHQQVGFSDMGALKPDPYDPNYYDGMIDNKKALVPNLMVGMAAARFKRGLKEFREPPLPAPAHTPPPQRLPPAAGGAVAHWQASPMPPATHRLPPSTAAVGMPVGRPHAAMGHPAVDHRQDHITGTGHHGYGLVAPGYHSTEPKRRTPSPRPPTETRPTLQREDSFHSLDDPEPEQKQEKGLVKSRFR